MRQLCPIARPQSYVNRVAHRLKKWAGVLVEQQYAPKEDLQHKSTLCLGGSGPNLSNDRAISPPINWHGLERTVKMPQ